MNPVRLALLFLVAALSGFWPRASIAQSFPSKQVDIVVPFAPGGAVDVVARIMANALSAQWGKPVIVENRAGGNTVIATRLVSGAEPDGHKLLFTIGDTFTSIPHLSRHKTFEPLKELAPINLLAKIPHVILANPNLPVENLPALIAYAKANPHKLSYGSSGAGSTIHLSMEMLKAKTGIDILHVPYRGLLPAITAAVAGDVQLTVSGYGTVKEMIASGKLRPLAAAAPARIVTLANIPTTAELGYPEVDATSWLTIAAPARTPVEIIDKINADVSRALNDPAVRRQLTDIRGFVVTNEGPAAFGKEIAEKSKLDAEAIRISGAYLD